MISSRLSFPDTIPMLIPARSVGVFLKIPSRLSFPGRHTEAHSGAVPEISSRLQRMILAAVFGMRRFVPGKAGKTIGAARSHTTCFAPRQAAFFIQAAGSGRSWNGAWRAKATCFPDFPRNPYTAF